MRSFALLTALFFATSALAADVVYVSVAGEKRIAVYTIAADGKLTAAGDIATGGEPGALIADPQRRFLFAAMRSTGELAAFRIDPMSGKLTHINTVPAGADPAHISTDKAGKHLLTAYYVAGKVTVHAIGDDGSIGKEPLQTVKTQEKAHAIVLDPGEFVALVPHTGPNTIHYFSWLDNQLKPWPSSQGPYSTPASTGPRHAVFHPRLRISSGTDSDFRVAYIANEQGGSVTVYHVDVHPFNQLLRAEQTVSALPADFNGTNACAEIRLHPSNRFLYVSNRGHDSIAGFQVDEKTGRLTALGQTPTEKTPRSFDIDPTGKFLYAGGESSGRLAAHRVDEKTGALERAATYDVGKTPWWVMAVRLPGK